ncbi:MAG: alkane 1-monooxygenase, partial [Bacteroidetes bacterium]|nr:alkane 1-monooxygenase [Bacteroidota bacterium]
MVELLTKPNPTNPEDLDERGKKRFYDFLLYASVPVQVGFLFYFFHVISTDSFSFIEYVGITLSMGLMCGVFGINIAHELGHRPKRYEQLLAEILLLTSLEMHFLPYHNNGHHKNVGTRKDPATARKGEPVYVFWFRSQIGSYFQAWSLEAKRLKKRSMMPYSLKNRAFAYTIIQLVFIGAIYYFYGLLPLSLFTIASVFGILLLETVNYIEHYGLMRTQNESGYYERV